MMEHIKPSTGMKKKEGQRSTTIALDAISASMYVRYKTASHREKSNGKKAENK
jgi:hypothetical protein